MIRPRIGETEINIANHVAHCTHGGTGSGYGNGFGQGTGFGFGDLQSSSGYGREKYIA